MQDKVLIPRDEARHRADVLAYRIEALCAGLLLGEHGPCCVWVNSTGDIVWGKHVPAGVREVHFIPKSTPEFISAAAEVFGRRLRKDDPGYRAQLEARIWPWAMFATAAGPKS